MDHKVTTNAIDRVLKSRDNARYSALHFISSVVSFFFLVILSHTKIKEIDAITNSPSSVELSKNDLEDLKLVSSDLKRMHTGFGVMFFYSLGALTLSLHTRRISSERKRAFFGRYDDKQYVLLTGRNIDLKFECGSKYQTQEAAISYYDSSGTDLYCLYFHNGRYGPMLYVDSLNVLPADSTIIGEYLDGKRLRYVEDTFSKAISDTRKISDYVEQETFKTINLFKSIQNFARKESIHQIVFGEFDKEDGLFTEHEKIDIRDLDRFLSRVEGIKRGGLK